MKAGRGIRDHKINKGYDGASLPQADEAIILKEHEDTSSIQLVLSMHDSDEGAFGGKHHDISDDIDVKRRRRSRRRRRENRHGCIHH